MNGKEPIRMAVLKNNESSVEAAAGVYSAAVSNRSRIYDEE